jgi:hypothetical protein
MPFRCRGHIPETPTGAPGNENWRLYGPSFTGNSGVTAAQPEIGSSEIRMVGWATTASSTAR